MRRFYWTKYFLVIPLLLAGIYTTAVILEVQEPSWLMAQTKKEDGHVLKGKVESLLTNDHDDVDGLRLESGEEIHFPPHFGRKVGELIKAGSDVEIQARKETRPMGKVVFEATQIQSQGTTITVDRPGPKHHPKDKRHPEKPMNVNGKVLSFTPNRHGDVDGFLLEDKTEVKFPPHMSEALQALVKPGSAVTIEGRRHETPEGSVHLHADRITDAASGKFLERSEPAGHGPEGGPRGPAHEEIMRELRAIRKLLEDQKVPQP